MMSTKYGIDALSFYSAGYYLDSASLAKKRAVDVDKFYTGIGFKKIAVNPPDEDVVTMAANAADKIFQTNSKEGVDHIIFATESGVDYSKSAGTYLLSLLNLPNNCRVFEVKQACYGATAGMQIAIGLLHSKPSSKILLVASDIARYGLGTPGEPSQGCGAVAMLITANPRILAIEPWSGVYAEDTLDFWRPMYSEYPLVNGRYSCDLYLRILEKTWQRYQAESGISANDINYFCYHVSVPNLVLKAHKRFLAASGLPAEVSPEQQLENSLFYGREIGNCYAASLFLSLLSALDNNQQSMARGRVGFYSYGSGCVAEYFSGVVEDNYQAQITPAANKDFLLKRKELSYSDYEYFYNFKLPIDGHSFVVPKHDTGLYRLAAVENHKRFYEKNSSSTS